MSRAASFPVLLLMFSLACGGAPPASEGSETSTETGDAPETSGEGFVTDTPAQPDSCDPFAQDCPDGEKCVPYASNGGIWDTNRCVPILGDGAPGEPCSSAGRAEATDDCDASSVCWHVGESGGELIGTCQPFCTGSADEPSCPDGWYCLPYDDGIRNICEWMCDPIAQDCADGEGCYWSGTNFACLDAAGWGIPAGEPCYNTNECEPGLVCVSLEELPNCLGRFCCTSFCDVALGDEPCGVVPGTVCVPFFEDGQAPIGLENVGTCTVP